MLCPEVWDFPYTKNNISFQTGILDTKNEKNLKKLIHKHPFNEIISIILPNEKSVPSQIADVIRLSDYYIIKEFQLQDLIRKDFIEAFVKRGTFTSLSYGKSIDVDDVFAVTPDGLLILSICKDLYQSLGLQGRAHSNSIKTKEKYVIQINLKNPDLSPTTKYYERIKHCLSHELLSSVNNGASITMQLFWTPPENSEICPSSIAKYFHNLGRTVELKQPQLNIHHETSLRFPKLLQNNNEQFKINDIELFHDFVEYLGMALLSCDTNPDKYISSFEIISESCEINEESAKIIHSKGFQTVDLIWQLIQVIRDILKTSNKIWIALCINGNRVTPVNFFNVDHNFSTNGDNDYIIVFYPNNKYILYKNVSSNKVVK